MTDEEKTQRPRLHGVLMALAATGFWALGSVLTKHSLIHYSPLTLLAIELGASNCALLAALAVTGGSLPGMRAMSRLSLPGLLQPGLAYALSFIGLKWMDSISIETLVWSAEGVLMIPFSAVFLGEKVSVTTVALGCIAFCGIGLVTLPAGVADGASQRSLAGSAMIIAAVFAACWYTVLAQRDLRRNDPLLLVFLHHLAGFVLVLALLGIFRKPVGTPSIASIASFCEAIAAGLCIFGIPFCLYLRSLQLIGSSMAAQFLTIVPVLTMFLALIFLHEALTGIQLVGAAVTIVSIALMAS